MVDYFGANVTIRTNDEMTGGSFSLSVFWVTECSSAPSHIHQEEDEMCDVLDGEIVGKAREDGAEKQTTLAASSTYTIPKGTEHTYIVTSEEAKMLVMPHALQFEYWFVDLGEPMDRYELPAPGSVAENQAKAVAITLEPCA